MTHQKAILSVVVLKVPIHFPQPIYGAKYEGLRLVSQQTRMVPLKIFLKIETDKDFPNRCGRERK